jgi:hypothetical protein
MYLERSKNKCPQNTWRPQENFLILILYTYNDIATNHRDIFYFLQNKLGILKVLILMKSMTKKHVEYILACDPFRVDNVGRKTMMCVVQPEKLLRLYQQPARLYISDQYCDVHAVE